MNGILKMNGEIEKKQNHIVASCRIITKEEEVQTEEYDLSKQLNTIVNKKMEEMLFKIMMEENERLRRETYFLRTDLFNSQEATITREKEHPIDDAAAKCIKSSLSCEHNESCEHIIPVLKPGLPPLPKLTPLPKNISEDCPRSKPCSPEITLEDCPKNRSKPCYPEKTKSTRKGVYKLRGMLIRKNAFYRKFLHNNPEQIPIENIIYLQQEQRQQQQQMQQQQQKQLQQHVQQRVQQQMQHHCLQQLLKNNQMQRQLQLQQQLQQQQTQEKQLHLYIPQQLKQQQLQQRMQRQRLHEELLQKKQQQKNYQIQQQKQLQYQHMLQLQQQRRQQTRQ